MNESEFKHKFVDAMRKAGAHVTIIENVAETGTPDLHIAFERTEAWVEVKTAKGDFLYFEKFQLPWLRRRCRVTNGARTWVLALVDGRARLYCARHVLQANTEVYGKWVRLRHTDLPARKVVELAGFDGLVDALLTE